MIATTVRVSVHLTPHPGKLDEFRSIAHALTSVSQNEPGTVGYEWFISGERYRLLETYTDVAAILAHFKGAAVQEWVPKLVAVCTVDSFEIYGDPGPEVTAMVSGLGAQLFPYWIGLGR